MICRATNCTESLSDNWKLMCGRHWHLVPEPVKRLINKHRDTDKEAFETAVAAAIRSVERAEFGERLL